MFLLIPLYALVDVLRIFHFTFHNVSINTGKSRWADGIRTSLHSTMFLLIPVKEWKRQINNAPLHSTMFLLIRDAMRNARARHSSLHSTMFLLILPEYTGKRRLLQALHSTMFLLIPERTEQTASREKTLHSTMFLLILTCDRIYSEVLLLYIPQCFY